MWLIRGPFYVSRVFICGDLVGVVTVLHKQLNGVLFLQLIKRVPLEPVAHIGTRHTV